MHITTNNQPRELVCFWELTDKEQQIARARFDWMDDIERETGFFKYRGEIFNVSQFTRVVPAASHPLKDWHGHHADSHFSGTLVRLSDNGGSVIVGRYLS